MSTSIGTLLGSFAGSPLQPRGGAGDVAGGPQASFADRLEGAFRERAVRLGLELPSPAAASGATESADDTWTRVQRADAAVNGVADAVMQSLAEAADARHDRRHRRGSDLFGS